MDETNDVLKAIGQRVKQVRHHFNLRQNNFAHALDISNANLCEIEAGIAKPRFEFLYAISLKFNVNLLYLLHGKGEMFITEKKEGDGEGEEIKDEYEEPVRQLKKLPQYREWLKDFLRYFNDSPMVRYAVMCHFITYKNQNEELIKKDMQLRLCNEIK